MSITAQNPEASIEPMMLYMGRLAREAAGELALAATDVKNAALGRMAARLETGSEKIIAANRQDLEAAEKKGRDAAFLDRLRLDGLRIAAMAKGLHEIAALPDPVGTTIAAWTRPNGLEIARVRVPLGVIGMIYESRPNVTADARGLCLKAGNAVMLRSGSDSFLTSLVIANLLTEAVTASGLPEAAIQLVPTIDRQAVGFMLGGLDGAIDVIVPRGGRSLVERVQQEARVPVFAHLEGVCHVYVDKSADLDMAKNIVVNAKMRRPGICGAAETLLVDRGAASSHLAPLVDALLHAGCEVRGDEETQRADTRVKPAADDDWGAEYLAPIIAVKVVDGLDEAVAHIAHYGSQHTDAIVTDDQNTANAFLARVDSAIVLHNASTQFADGGEFGMGAEIGIATGRFHARGPVGLEQLTTFKYVVRGQGQTRP
ncbi:gamma-glutamyl-phosphate reductase [Methyloceanibacter superfactus]|uniref:Gamma-glutamyl phosphate reductase n=1 Tax=Methyloceanibacter superfactus TaxID=1774969 RepID=A0A1E3VTX9_9HYPH|nr:glutamate-5-semialdehyde dehydrogenase [Methyloceanibacter superfactus]ODR96977.1 gamma-glutamyl-phosphate reductase [Methyloceanibacter superfactus]